MNKIIKVCYLLSSFFLISCDCSTFDTNHIYRGMDKYGNSVSEYTIDGHNYIKIGYDGLIHSGACKKCKQERDSVINLIIQKLNNLKDETK